MFDRQFQVHEVASHTFASYLRVNANFRWRRENLLNYYLVSVSFAMQDTNKIHR